jgi:fumarate hydratase class II
MAAAGVNQALGLLEPRIADTIERAAAEVAEGRWDDQFPIDVFQTGSGTSTNMNANEVIASRANEILGGHKGDKKPVHPNDQVNMGQSSNDIIPGTMNVATVLAIERDLLPALKHLHAALDAKAKAFDDVIKIGRTHLMDATPIRLGQEFSGYASQVEHGIERLEAALPHLRELAIGGTAVGTGLNAHEEFGALVAKELGTLANTRFTEARNHFEAQHARDSIVFAAGALNTLAASLMKIANDIRILASGPQTGLGEITIPSLQPGSSIMPGKVNPVIPEAVTQVAAQVTGNTVATTIGGQWGQLDLHTQMPLMTRNILESILLLSNVSRVFADKCISGIQANREKCLSYIEYSASMVTPLAPKIGYDKAAEIAKTALKTGRTVRQVAYELSGLSKAEVDAALDPRVQTQPGGTGSGGG